MTHSRSQYHHRSRTRRRRRRARSTEEVLKMIDEAIVDAEWRPNTPPATPDRPVPPSNPSPNGK